MPSLDELEARIAALEDSTIALGDLPLATLQRKLEDGWQPDASILLQEGSITTPLIAAGSITTPLIAAGSITTPLIAAGSVVGSSLGGGAIKTAASLLRLVRGEVSAAGGVAKGEGFTVVRNAAGDYSVTFSVAFAAVPVVVVSVGSIVAPKGVHLHVTTPPTAAAFRVICFTTTTGAAVDSIFNFIALGVA